MIARWMGAAPRQRANSRHQFGAGEGFDKVIVGARFQAAHAVFDGVAGGQQQHRQGVAARAQAPQHFEAVDAGQADVDHRHRRRRRALQQLVGQQAVAHQFDMDGLRLEHAHDAVGQHGVVFD